VAGYSPGVRPDTLDHVALWVAERDRIAGFVTERLGMHVVDRTDAFTLVGSDARRGKLTLFGAEGPREQGALKHVALWSRSPKETADEYARLGFEPAAQGPAGAPRVEAGGAFVEFHQGEPGDPEKPLLNHLAVKVDSADEHIAEARELGLEIADIVDAANTYAVFVWGPERVKVEYVEHKPEFSLT